jgi:hypothetical protein
MNNQVYAVPKPNFKKQRVPKKHSLIEKKCYVTGATEGLHKHHIFYGTGNRKLSEQYGMYVYLIPRLHNMSNEGVHFNKAFDLELKQEAQRNFEAEYSREFFVKVFGENYLD